MFVKQGIGRQAGEIIDMPFAEAKACLENGTVTKPTDEEVLAAQEEALTRGPDIHPDQLLVGWRTEPSVAGGFDLYDPGGVKVNEEPFHNQIAARDGAIAAARRSRGLPDLFGEKTSADGISGDGGVDYSKMTVEQLRAESDARKLDSSKATKKADWIALLERDDEVKVAIAAGNFDALTIPELQKAAADRNIDLTGKTAKSDLVEAVKAAYEPAPVTAA